MLSNFVRYVDSKIEKNFRVFQKDNQVSLQWQMNLEIKLFSFFYSGRYNESPYISGNADVTENSELISEHGPFKIVRKAFIIPSL